MNNDRVLLDDYLLQMLLYNPEALLVLSEWTSCQSGDKQPCHIPWPHIHDMIGLSQCPRVKVYSNGIHQGHMNFKHAGFFGFEPGYGIYHTCEW
ncbi:hypothetical protein CDAR_385351 [Caerostris darwini]|uniref:Uncharacterized protein n=1 Tax=Caerostris darwini TaxID=1538125 RepID=A0AAV4PDT8_9ARAC|nr:hypothetical protein CDAR_385351 [Caerostris darwini]